MRFKTTNEKLDFLEALIQTGVDNWEGYNIAVDLYEEWQAENEEQ